MKKLSLITLVTLLVLATTSTSAFAHGEGGVLQIGDRTVGQYLLHAWTSPGIPRLGETHLEALITSRDGKPVDKCQVVMVVTSHADGSIQRMTATDSVAQNQFRHEGIAMLSTPGGYTVDIIVFENGQRLGQSNFDINVPLPPRWLSFGLNGILSCLALVGVWFIRQGYSLIWTMR